MGPRRDGMGLEGLPEGREPVVDVVLNGAQPSPVLKHTSTGWTLM